MVTVVSEKMNPSSKLSLGMQVNEGTADKVTATLPMVGLAGTTKAEIILVKADGQIAGKTEPVAWPGGRIKWPPMAVALETVVMQLEDNYILQSSCRQPVDWSPPKSLVNWIPVSRILETESP